MIRKIKRLPEVMKVSADTIEGLYKELKRAPPPDVEAVIRELHELARDRRLHQPGVSKCQS
jgi:hypothetical protein